MVPTTRPIPQTMHGVLLTGHGGLDKLDYRTDLAVPKPGVGEVLIRVHAAGVNNTDINTRTGWYSKAVTGASGDEGGTGDAGDAAWSGVPLQLPRIQGADCCGTIVAVGEGVDEGRIGERVLVATMQASLGEGGVYDFGTFGSERDGAFAQYCVALATETHAVETELSDIELGAIPCAFSTAEGMLQRAGVTGADRIFVTGASGGVGMAAVQLARLRGAHIVAQASAGKAEAVRAAGADEVVDRDADLLTYPGARSMDVVVDVVAGPAFPTVIALLKRGGRYVTAGAIAGPIVELDVRDLYLKDLTLFGSTYQPASVFSAIVDHVNAGRLRPLVSKTYPLSEIRLAQDAFMAKTYPGKIVLIPPVDDA
ncbi:alcohol dehydrogenase family protein [Aurantimonas sp. E1-2-R+4]|uniref:alcohol dehydrogenase family protein n=1 Tax=Aurantimonas sp. E1-2-R+4 TaxID=3113714 RepID=UPI002F937886